MGPKVVVGNLENLVIQSINVSTIMDKGKHKAIWIVKNQILESVKEKGNGVFNFGKSSNVISCPLSNDNNVGGMLWGKPPNDGSGGFLQNSVAMKDLVQNLEWRVERTPMEDDEPSREEVMEDKSVYNDKVNCWVSCSIMGFVLLLFSFIFFLIQRFSVGIVKDLGIPESII